MRVWHPSHISCRSGPGAFWGWCDSRAETHKLHRFVAAPNPDLDGSTWSTVRI
jgi:hypothetical protein